MRIAFLADLHVTNFKAHGGPVVAGLNYRCRLVLDCLKRAVATARLQKCGALYIAGDVFDTVRPEPQVIAAVQEILNVPDMHVVAVLGNHDQVSTAPKDHALGPLEPVVDVITKPTVIDEEDGVQVVVIPFEPGAASAWLPVRVGQLAFRRDALLVTHVGISTPEDPAFLRAAHDQVPVTLLADLAASKGFRMMFAGNWHTHRTFMPVAPAVQIGTLAPTGWNNPGLKGYGTMPIFDSHTGQLQVAEVPGPRFLNVTHEGIDPTLYDKHVLYLRYRTDREHLNQVQAEGAQLVEQAKIAAFEVVFNDIEVRAEARLAATIARSAETLDQALAGFVEQMPLPEGVDRLEVLARSKAFLHGGGTHE